MVDQGREELLLAIRRAITEAHAAAHAITARLHGGCDVDAEDPPADEDGHSVLHLLGDLHQLAVTAISRMAAGLEHVDPPPGTEPSKSPQIAEEPSRSGDAAS